MRILAVDYGLKRVGLAISDPMGILASPLRTLPHDGEAQVIAGILQAVEETGAQRVLIGLPRRTTGELGDAARRVLVFAHSLASRLPVPITSLNEVYTSREAHSRLKAMGGKRRDPRQDKAFIDQLAAMILLEEYLTCVPSEPEPLPALPPEPEPSTPAQGQ